MGRLLTSIQLDGANLHAVAALVTEVGVLVARGVKRRLDGVDVLVLSAILATGLIKQLELAAGMAVADLLLVAIMVVALQTRSQAQGAVMSAVKRAAPFVYLFVLGSALSISKYGISGSALDSVVRDLFVIAAFFAVWAVLASRPWLVSRSHPAFLMMTVVIAISVLLDSGYRPGGLIGPNYAGHLVMLGAVLTAYLPTRLLVRVVIVAVLVAAFLRTGSFGALGLPAGSLAYWLWTRRPGDRRLQVVLRLALVLAAVTLGPRMLQEVRSEGLQVGSAFDSDRLDRSSGTRFEIWEVALDTAMDNPFGVGPGQFEQQMYFPIHSAEGLEGLETHSDPLGFLVENGLIGVLGIVGLLTVISRSARSGGMSRAVLAGCIVASFSRDTFNFRHMWIGLAICLAIEQFDTTAHRNARSLDVVLGRTNRSRTGTTSGVELR